jgi:hypothetical protein
MMVVVVVVVVVIVVVVVRLPCERGLMGTWDSRVKRKVRMDRGGFMAHGE